MGAISFEDYVAICATKARYCRCLDTKDWAGYADVFTPDLQLDTRPSGGPLIEGRDAAIEFVRGSIGSAVTAHHVHSPEISMNGDSASVIWAMQDRVIFDPERANLPFSGLTGYGHYHEEYRRCADGVWRIAKSALTRLHMDYDPATARA